MAKGTYKFKHLEGSQKEMILDDVTLWVESGPYFSKEIFEDASSAAKAFNAELTDRFHPRHGWQIVEKRMGDAVEPALERQAAYVMEQREKKAKEEAAQPREIDIGKVHVNLHEGHLILNVAKVEFMEVLAFLENQQEHFQHLYLYGKKSVVDVLAAFSAMGHETLETLIVDAYDNTDTRQSQCRVGDLTPVLEGCPKLRRLFVIGQCLMSEDVEHTALEHVTIGGNPIDASLVATLSRCDFPALQKLELGLSFEVESPDVKRDVQVLVDRTPTLDDVSLFGDFDLPDLLASWGARRMPKRLATNTGGEEPELAAAVLLERAAASVERLEPVKTLALTENVETWLEDDWKEKLTAVEIQTEVVDSPFLPDFAYAKKDYLWFIPVPDDGEPGSEATESSGGEAP